MFTRICADKLLNHSWNSHLQKNNDAKNGSAFDFIYWEILPFLNFHKTIFGSTHTCHIGQNPAFCQLLRLKFFLSTIWLTQGESFIHLMLTTVIQFSQKGHCQRHNKVGSPSPAEHLLRFYNGLIHWATFPFFIFCQHRKNWISPVSDRTLANSQIAKSLITNK